MTPVEWTSILVALIAAGLLKYAVDLIKWYAAKRKGLADAKARPESPAMQTVDQSLAIVAKARDELESDNALLRAVLAEERASRASEIADLTQRHQAERAVWATEKTGLKAEIADLERRLREMLREVENIRRRTSEV